MSSASSTVPFWPFCRPCWAPNWARGGYIARLPEDPWGRSYQYLQPGVHGDFDVFSYGADGQPGLQTRLQLFGRAAEQKFGVLEKVAAP